DLGQTLRIVKACRFASRFKGSERPCRHQGWATIRVPQRIAEEWFCAQPQLRHGSLPAHAHVSRQQFRKHL
ncbi:hypothetical protein, partial [Bradyrhizobium cytisi]|uniref:hypothetical protein n=1 Tax=Bradyrhizobium cytisi TaxID=515489 RepID=UPI001AEDB1B7